MPRHHARAQALSTRTHASLARPIARVNTAGPTTTHVLLTGSTNSDLLAEVRAAAGRGEAAFQRRLLVAERQSSGRGRHGRQWASAEGASLLCSWAWPFAAQHDLSGLSLAVGCAIADALDPGRARLGLKWPNDVLLRDEAPGREGRIGRKLAGILIETAPLGPWRVAVIGVGLNVRPLDVDEASSGVACLAEIDAGATPASALAMLAGPMDKALRRFEQRGFAAFEASFAERDLLRGHCVQAGTREGSIAGTAAGISATGELLVHTVHGAVPVRSGEVRLAIGPLSSSTSASPGTTDAAAC